MTEDDEPFHAVKHISSILSYHLLHVAGGRLHTSSQLVVYVHNVLLVCFDKGAVGGEWVVFID